jgi:hypothetical protein
MSETDCCFDDGGESREKRLVCLFVDNRGCTCSAVISVQELESSLEVFQWLHTKFYDYSEVFFHLDRRFFRLRVLEALSLWHNTIATFV